MGKRARLVSTYSHQKGCNSVDRISQLPEEILLSILSFLTLREAAVTSVIARPWRHLWASISNLYFLASESLDTASLEEGSLYKERVKYVKWVNLVMGLHKGPILNEFKVRFDLDKNFRCSINKWLKFALTKRIQKLELDLSVSRHDFRNPRMCYTFPLKILGQRPSFIGMKPCSFVGFKSLKDLCLNCVSVTGEVVEHILSHCPVLEILTVRGSDYLRSLKAAGPSLMLKYLKIDCCSQIETIEICDTNLVSFHYTGEKIGLHFENVPLLAEVSVGIHSNYENLNYVLGQISCCLSQLEILTLHVCSILYLKEVCRAFPEFPKLKHLVLPIGILDNQSVLGIISLIKAVPNLQRFTLRVESRKYMKRKRREVWKDLKCPHEYLKVVELTGFYGTKSDLELAMYFINNAVALEKIIIDPRTLYPFLPKDKKSEFEKTARILAKQHLEGNVSPRVQLVIL